MKTECTCLSEFGLIDQIRQLFQQPTAPELGIGDDAAILTTTTGHQLLVSTDLLTENIHFRLDFGSAALLGRKALAVNLSDLAAMGALPRWFFLSLAIPHNFSDRTMLELLGGMAEQAAAHNCILAGGDTCSSKAGLTISITIIGEQQPDLILKRSNARIGDDIWVSGNLGDSSLGLELLLKGRRTGTADDFLLMRHLDPTPRTTLGTALAKSGLVHGMVDISDGLLADLGHICKQSGCGAEINLGELPLSEQFVEHFDGISNLDWNLAACGGEDFELCFTAAQDSRQKILAISESTGVPLTRVGTVTDNNKTVQARLPDGTIFNPYSSGYTHF